MDVDCTENSENVYRSGIETHHCEPFAQRSVLSLKLLNGFVSNVLLRVGSTFKIVACI